MRKKTRHQMYKPEKSKVMKMKDEFQDMEDMCDIDDMDEDMDEMEDMENMAPQKHYMESMKMHHHMSEMGAIFPECIQLAHSYVPWQTYEKAFTPPEALMKGTLFPELWGVYRIPK
ncbi:MAG: Spore coat associated protein (CotJA) [Firmicutes bacterium]|nr:Spore coat associated protein (CotJA) [Bacillota bacterium]